MGLSLFILLLFLGIFLSIHGLPGLALIAADVLAYAAVTEFEKIGWMTVLAFALLAVSLEIMDVFWAVKSSPRFGPSRKSIIYSLFGAFVLALALTPSFLVAGLVGGFFVGGLSGLLLAVYVQESKLKPSHRMPFGVMFGRVSTLFLKGSVATVFVCFTLLSSYD